MAINPNGQIPNTLVPSTNHPYGSARNVSAQGAGDGTPLLGLWLNDMWGFFQTLLKEGGDLVPNGNPDGISNQQYLGGMKNIFCQLVDNKTWENATALALLLSNQDAAIGFDGVDFANVAKRIDCDQSFGDWDFRLGNHAPAAVDVYNTDTTGAAKIRFQGDAEDGFLQFLVALQNPGVAGDPVTWAQDFILGAAGGMSLNGEPFPNFPKQVNANGHWIEIPAKQGGSLKPLLIQWSNGFSASSSGGSTLTFPVPFDSVSSYSITSWCGNSNGSAAATDRGVMFLDGATNSDFTAICRDPSGLVGWANISANFYWIAIGY